jgi:hypothetical protein
MITNEWIEWNGGECPVDGKTWVRIKCKDSTPNATYEARSLDWKHTGAWSDIIAYRLSKEQA